MTVGVQASAVHDEDGRFAVTLADAAGGVGIAGQVHVLARLWPQTLLEDGAEKACGREVARTNRLR